jgi:sulfite exporter TauE/SafE
MSAGVRRVTLPAVEANLNLLLSWCGAMPIAEGTVLTLFVAGLVGAPVHCGAMCGGFVLGQVADHMAALPAAGLCEWQRIKAGALLPYHLGRLTTYGLLGAIAGFGSAALLPRWIAAALLVAGAALFLLRGLGPVAGFVPPAWKRAVVWLTGKARRNQYLLGAALGFLPCGFLYVALAVAAASQNAATGALGMVAFGLGTVPTLLVVGIAGQLAGRRWQRKIAAFAPGLMALNAVLLLILALRTV